MPVVLVHGVPDTPQLWDRVREHLGRKDVLTPQLPGFGCPVPDGFDCTKEAYADWLTKVVESIGEPVDLVGHDWGSILVQRVATTRPDLIRTWACGGGAVDETYVWHDVAQLWQTPEVGEQVMDAMTPDALVPALVDGGVPEDDARAAATHVDAAMKGAILALYRSAVAVGDEWGPALDRNERPALVLWGAGDPYAAPSFGDRLAARLGGECVVLEDCGHWWPAQRPAEVAAALTDLFSTQ
jgi:pimeloyl-ACP methyl ester carboxylesterase